MTDVTDDLEKRGRLENAKMQHDFGEAYDSTMQRVSSALRDVPAEKMDEYQQRLGLSKLVELGEKAANLADGRGVIPNRHQFDAMVQLDALQGSEEHRRLLERGTPDERKAARERSRALSLAAFGWTNGSTGIGGKRT